MRIDAYNQISQIYAANRPKQVKKSGEVSAAKDEFKLSSKGKELQVAKQAVKDAPDIREDKVAEIKSKIDAGTYDVDTGDFASVLMQKFQNGGF